MSFDKKKEADPMLQEQLRMAQEDHEQKKAQMKQMEQQGQMAEALAPALQALAQAQQEQQMGQIGRPARGSEPLRAGVVSDARPGRLGRQRVAEHQRRLGGFEQHDRPAHRPRQRRWRRRESRLAFAGATCGRSSNTYL